MEAVIRTLKYLWRLKNGFEIRNVGRITENQPWSIDKHLAVMQKFDESMKFHELAFDKEENKSRTLRQATKTEGGSPEVGNPLCAELEKMTARVCIEKEKGINDGSVTNNEQTAEVDKQKETAAFNSNSSSGPRFYLPKNSGLSLNENYTLPKTVVPDSPINTQESRSLSECIIANEVSVTKEGEVGDTLQPNTIEGLTSPAVAYKFVEASRVDSEIKKEKELNSKASNKEKLFDIKIKEIDTELAKFDEDPDFMGCTLKQSQRQVVNMVNIPNKEKSSTTARKGNVLDKSNQPPHRAIWKPPPRSILKVNSDDANFWEQNYVGVVLDMGGGLVMIWRSTIDEIVEGSGTNYIDTMFQEEDRAGIGVIIRECQGKGLAHMVGIIPLPLTIIELGTLAISKALQLDADLSLEDVTSEGVSKIAMNALNADPQSLESFGLLSHDIKCFASLFHCIRFSHVHRKRLLYSHIKRNDNGVAHNLAKNTLCIPDFQVWMEDVPSHFGSILRLDVVEFY